MERTSFSIDKDSQPLFDKLSKRYGMNKKLLFESMLKYLDTLGVDPRELDGTTFNKEFTALKKDISNLRETTVSFIRQQEKGLLKPLIDQVNTNTQQLLNYLSQEPLTVKHLEQFNSLIATVNIRTKNQQNITEKTGISEPEQSPEQSKDYEAQVQNIKTKAELVITHAKQLFKEFIETGKKVTVGRGVSFEESIINNYKGEFERLKLKL